MIRQRLLRHPKTEHLGSPLTSLELPNLCKKKTSMKFKLLDPDIMRDTTVTAVQAAKKEVLSHLPRKIVQCDTKSVVNKEDSSDHECERKELSMGNQNKPITPLCDLIPPVQLSVCLSGRISNVSDVPTEESYDQILTKESSQIDRGPSEPCGNGPSSQSTLEELIPQLTDVSVLSVQARREEEDLGKNDMSDENIDKIVSNSNHNPIPSFEQMFGVDIPSSANESPERVFGSAKVSSAGEQRDVFISEPNAPIDLSSQSGEKRADQANHSEYTKRNIFEFSSVTLGSGNDEGGLTSSAIENQMDSNLQTVSTTPEAVLPEKTNESSNLKMNTFANISDFDLPSSSSPSAITEESPGKLALRRFSISKKDVLRVFGMKEPAESEGLSVGAIQPREEGNDDKYFLDDNTVTFGPEVLEEIVNVNGDSPQEVCASEKIMENVSPVDPINSKLVILQGYDDNAYMCEDISSFPHSRIGASTSEASNNVARSNPGSFPDASSLVSSPWQANEEKVSFVTSFSTDNEISVPSASTVNSLNSAHQSINQTELMIPSMDHHCGDVNSTCNLTDVPSFGLGPLESNMLQTPLNNESKVTNLGDAIENANTGDINFSSAVTLSATSSSIGPSQVETEFEINSLPDSKMDHSEESLKTAVSESEKNHLVRVSTLQKQTPLVTTSENVCVDALESCPSVENPCMSTQETSPINKLQTEASPTFSTVTNIAVAGTTASPFNQAVMDEALRLCSDREEAEEEASVWSLVDIAHLDLVNEPDDTVSAVHWLFSQTRGSSRHEELKERARLLLEAARRDAASAADDATTRVGPGERSLSKEEEERQLTLRERARRLIAEAKQGVVSPPRSLTSPVRPSAGSPPLRHQRSEERVPESGVVIISSKGTDGKLEPSLSSSPATNIESARANGSTSPTASDAEASACPPSPATSSSATNLVSEDQGEPGSQRTSVRAIQLQSFSNIIDRMSPEKEAAAAPPVSEKAQTAGRERSQYLTGELLALEREQEQIDAQAAKLEKKLRRVMEAGNRAAEEERLMQRWFTLVNKKNALIRRQEQLSILEKESNLERRFELLNRELRAILAIEDHQKTEVQQRQESLLLDELVQIVNMRNELVNHLDSQEKMLDDDQRIAQDVSRASVKATQEKCLVM